MADTVGEATFLVKIRDMVTGPMKGIAASISTTMRDISKIAAGNLLSTGITRAVDAMKNFVAQGIATNMQMDNLNVTFTTMLGSQRKANKLMAELVTFAAKTPFEMEGLAQNAAALLATGNVGEQQVIPMLKKLGDAAAGSTEGFAAMPRVVRAIAQMMSKGKLQAEEMNQLAEAGIPAWGALAKQMGMTTAEVMAMASKGKLGMKEIGMLVDGLGNKYAGLADKQSKTFSGMLSTLKDNVALAMAKITRPIYDRMTTVMAAIAKYMDSGAFTKGLDRITGIVTHIMELLFKAFDSPLAMAAVKIAAVVAGVIAIGAALSWVPMLAGMAYAIAPFVATLGVIVGLAGTIGLLLQRAFSGPEGEKFRKKLAEIWFLIKEIGLNIRDAITPGLSAAAGWLGKMFSATGAIQKGFNGILDTLMNWSKYILDAVSIMTNDFSKTWEFMEAAGIAAVLSIADRFDYLFGTQIPFSIAAIVDGFGAAGLEIVNYWMTLFENLATYISNIFNDVTSNIARQITVRMKLVQAVASGDVERVKSVMGEVSALMGEGAASFNRRGVELRKANAEAGGGFSQKFAEAFAGVMKAMPGFKNSGEQQAARGHADNLWNQMRQGRNKKRADRFIDGLGMEQIPGKIGGFLGDMFAKGGMGLFGAVEDGLGLFAKKPDPAAADKKKKAKSEFVGFAEMNKHIQLQLGKEDKNAKAQLAAVKQGAAAAQQGAAAGVAVVKGVKEVHAELKKLFFGFSK